MDIYPLVYVKIAIEAMTIEIVRFPPKKRVIFHNIFVNIYKRLFDASWNLRGNLGYPTRGQLWFVATVKPLWSADDFLSQRCLGNMKSIGHLWLETWWNCDDHWSNYHSRWNTVHVCHKSGFGLTRTYYKTSAMATPIARLKMVKVPDVKLQRCWVYLTDDTI